MEVDGSIPTDRRTRREVVAIGQQDKKTRFLDDNEEENKRGENRHLKLYVMLSYCGLSSREYVFRCVDCRRQIGHACSPANNKNKSGICRCSDLSATSASPKLAVSGWYYKSVQQFNHGLFPLHRDSPAVITLPRWHLCEARRRVPRVLE